MKQKKESYFWASYSDLMTSLFFIMLVLFVLTIALLHSRMVEIGKERDATAKERDATAEQLEKIREVQRATEDIDNLYFEYSPQHKKHILKISVRFETGSADFDNIGSSTQAQLTEAGAAIRKFISQNSKDGIQYLLIIEGQASKDQYRHNYELSYKRALALKAYWENHNIGFGQSCEVLICGSGDGRLSGTDFMRESDSEINNQRFLIHIVPKYGTILSPSSLTKNVN